MKAILVTITATTRIIVPDSFDIEAISDKHYQILREKAWPRLIDQLNTDGIGDHLSEIEEDTQLPYNPLHDF